jgi:hypothetical protein
MNFESGVIFEARLIFLFDVLNEEPMRLNSNLDEKCNPTGAEQRVVKDNLLFPTDNIYFRHPVNEFSVILYFGNSTSLLLVGLINTVNNRDTPTSEI